MQEHKNLNNYFLKYLFFVFGGSLVFSILIIVLTKNVSTTTIFCENQESNSSSIIERLDNLKSVLHKSILDRNFNQKVPIEIGYTVPRRFIMLWIGSQMPDKYFTNLKLHRKVNKDYLIDLWLDDHSVPSLYRNLTKINGVSVNHIKDLNPINLNLIEQSCNDGFLADLLRYEIIYEYGGIYQDIDSIALKPFPKSIMIHSFVSHTIDKYNSITNSVFGFPRRSNFIGYVLSILQENYDYFEPILKNPKAKLSDIITSLSGPIFFNTAFYNFNDSNIYMIHQKYLVYPKSELSFTYHTMDANWLKKRQGE